LSANINGGLFREMILEAAWMIDDNKQKLNDLNVFPVPDGDTGTNMGLTIGAAARAVENKNDDDISTMADTTAMALLRGARGNSGVILSLLFRGVAKTLKGSASADAALWAQALQCGTETAYRAVMKPAEGTILTVSRLAAEAAAAAAASEETEPSVESVTAAALEAAKAALADTTNQNPVLAKAGVVDAGGAGWVYVLTSMLHILQGGERHVKQNVEPAEAPAAEAPASAQAAFETEDIRFAYCTEFIVGRSGDRDPELLNAFLDGIGDSAVLVYDDEIIKVHVHTNNPGTVLEEALTYGALETVKIENMRLQHSEKVMEGTSAPAEPEAPAAPAEPEAEVGFVAVCTGAGIASVFRDLGVNELVEGGQTMNPSTMDIYQAVEKVNAKTVFVLPNNKNIIMAAEQAEPLTKKRLIVLPTVSIPQGITAMLSFDPDASDDDNRDAMMEAASSVHTGQMTYAARDSSYDDRRIREGDYLSLVDGKLVDTDRKENDAYRHLARHMGKLKNISYVNVFYGEGVTEEQAEQMKALLEKEFKNAEVNVVNGGQPIYYYMISAE